MPPIMPSLHRSSNSQPQSRAHQRREHALSALTLPYCWPRRMDTSTVRRERQLAATCAWPSSEANIHSCSRPCRASNCSGQGTGLQVNQCRTLAGAASWSALRLQSCRYAVYTLHRSTHCNQAAVSGIVVPHLRHDKDGAVLDSTRRCRLRRVHHHSVEPGRAISSAQRQLHRRASPWTHVQEERLGRLFRPPRRWRPRCVAAFPERILCCDHLRSMRLKISHQIDVTVAAFRASSQPICRVQRRNSDDSTTLIASIPSRCSASAARPARPLTP